MVEFYHRAGITRLLVIFSSTLWIAACNHVAAVPVSELHAPKASQTIDAFIRIIEDTQRYEDLVGDYEAGRLSKELVLSKAEASSIELRRRLDDLRSTPNSLPTTTAGSEVTVGQAFEVLRRRLISEAEQLAYRSLVSAEQRVQSQLEENSQQESTNIALLEQLLDQTLEILEGHRKDYERSQNGTWHYHFLGVGRNASIAAKKIVEAQIEFSKSNNHLALAKANEFARTDLLRGTEHVEKASDILTRYTASLEEQRNLSRFKSTQVSLHEKLALNLAESMNKELAVLTLLQRYTVETDLLVEREQSVLYLRLSSLQFERAQLLAERLGLWQSSGLTGM